MTLLDYFSFLILVATMAYSPGPMTLFLMVHGMEMRYRTIFPILLGANNAYLISIIFFTVGVTELLQKNSFLLKSVQIVGIVYLLYLAYVQWNKPFSSTLQTTDIDVSKKSWALYTKGALIAFSNPKTIILFGIIFPQFIVDDDTRWIQIIILGITFLVLQFSSGCVYAYFGKRIKHVITKPFYQRLMNKIPAIVLVLIALLLAFKL